jgi:hypothetical protein
MLARRVAIAAWRLARADRLEVELFQERGYSNASPGLALIRDGNGTRSFETLLRYRGAAMAEFWRALRTLKALQAEARAHAPTSAEAGIGVPALSVPVPATSARPPSCPVRLDRSPARAACPNEPEGPGIPCGPGRSGDRANPSGAPRAGGSSRRVSPPPPPALPPGRGAPHARPNEPGPSSLSNPR